MFIFGELIIWAIFCIIFISYEKGFAAFYSTLILGVALWISGINVVMWSWSNPKLLAQYSLCYIGVGLGWAIFKFVVMLNAAKNTYIEDKKEYLSGDERTEEMWIHKVKHSYDGVQSYAPTVTENKEEIMFWLIWWPFSIFSFFLQDVMTGICRQLWKLVSGILNGIRVSVLGVAAKDLDEKDTK